MNIQSIVPSLFAALSIVENSDLLVALPERVALGNSHRFNIVHSPIPIEGGSFKIHAVRHARDADSPLHHWLQKRLISVMGNFVCGQSFPKS